MPRVRAGPLPRWLPPARLLGPGDWTPDGEHLVAELPVAAAADVTARLRGLGFAGRALLVEVDPPLPRAAVRAARALDARRRRDTTPGFQRAGVRLDEEGRVSLTPEALAMAMARPFSGRSVVDTTCGAGGDTIALARAGARVTAIERDPARLALARHNARVYGVEARVRWLVGDAVALLPTLSADLAYVDPPWGVAWDRTRTTLADLPLLAALRAVWRGSMLAKVPPSFDPEGWPGVDVEPIFGVAAGDERRVKYLLVRA